MTYVIDDLSYTYKTNSNQLQAVHDETNSTDGFKDGNQSNKDFYYDDYGNMIQDLNKKITAIKYNHLNLPTQIKFNTDGVNEIIYFYNAVGVKVGKKVRRTTPQTGIVENKTDYLNGFQYVDGNLQFFPTAEGYVSVTDNVKFNYVYNYTDHLGNIRVSYSVDPITLQIKILEENHYYPFGLKHSNYNEDRVQFEHDEIGVFAVLKPVEKGKYQYKYNGKELQDELGLNMYAMDMRQYDPAIGRWAVLDPISNHSTSPYSAFDNNPIYWADPSGALSQSFINELWNKSGNETTWTNNNDGTFSGDNGESAGKKDSSLKYTVLHDEKNEHQITWTKTNSSQTRTIGSGLNKKFVMDVITTRIETKIRLQNGRAIYESTQYVTISTTVLSDNGINSFGIGCAECSSKTTITELDNLNMYPIADEASRFIGNNIEVNPEYNLFNGNIKMSAFDNFGSGIKFGKKIIDNLNPNLLKGYPILGRITNGLFIYDISQKGMNFWRNHRDNTGKSAYYDVLDNGAVKFTGTN